MSFCFNFNQDIDAAQIQLFAKVVMCMLDKEFSMESAPLVDCAMPREAEDLQRLYSLCNSNQVGSYFYVTTPRFTCLEYETRRPRQITSFEVNRYLSDFQSCFYAFKHDNILIPYLELTDKLLSSFVVINTALTNFFISLADYSGSFNWNDKYCPCFFDRKWSSGVRDWIVGLELQARRVGRFTSVIDDTAKAILMSLFYQCGFLAFWFCLSDILSFPGCDEKEREVLKNLSMFLLAKYANVYVYNTVVENNPLGGGDVSPHRGSAENTTRIKLYLTRMDDSPVLLRMDLPHEGCSYVHLNIEENGINRHVRLSKEAQGNEYDHVFENLEIALLRFNFNVTEYVHSPGDQDKVIIRDMRYRTALMNYAPCSFYFLAFSAYEIKQEPLCVTNPLIINSRNTLFELLEADGYSLEELRSLDPPNLLEVAYKELQNA